MQVAPSGILSGIIKHFLILEREENTNLNYRLFSDGNPGIVFHFKNPLIQYTGHSWMGNAQPNSFIYGQITHYNDLKSSGKLGMLVVVLQPYGLYSLLHVAAHELNNRIIRLADLFGQEALDLEDQVLHASSVHYIIETIEGFFLRRLAHISGPDQVFKNCLQLIYKYKGLITIEELLKKIPITERQLERKFKQQIGTAPKKFSDIVKFQHFLKLLQNHPPGKTITDVVYNSGYYDQAHLNNYFKKVTGVTPLQYKAKHQHLALNFMQLSANS